VPAFLKYYKKILRLGQNDEARSVLRRGIEAAAKQGDGHAAGEMTEFLASID
jgi:hypothetical protein